MAMGFCNRRPYDLGLCTGLERRDPGYPAARDRPAGGRRRAAVHRAGLGGAVGSAAAASAARSRICSILWSASRRPEPAFALSPNPFTPPPPPPPYPPPPSQ